MTFEERLAHTDELIVSAMAEVRRYQDEGRHSSDEHSVFMQQMNLRHDRIHEQQLALARQAITDGREHSEERRRADAEQRRADAEQRAAAERLAEEQREEARAARGALFAILDRLNKEPPPTAA